MDAYGHIHTNVNSFLNNDNFEDYFIGNTTILNNLYSLITQYSLNAMSMNPVMIMITLMFIQSIIIYTHSLRCMTFIVVNRDITFSLYLLILYYQIIFICVCYNIDNI